MKFSYQVSLTILFLLHVKLCWIFTYFVRYVFYHPFFRIWQSQGCYYQACCIVIRPIDVIFWNMFIIDTRFLFSHDSHASLITPQVTRRNFGRYWLNLWDTIKNDNTNTSMMMFVHKQFGYRTCYRLGSSKTMNRILKAIMIIPIPAPMFLTRNRWDLSRYQTITSLRKENSILCTNPFSWTKFTKVTGEVK